MLLIIYLIYIDYVFYAMCSFYCVPEHGNCHVMAWWMQAAFAVKFRYSETRWNGHPVVSLHFSISYRWACNIMYERIQL
jgi:hypothetical protein